MSVLHFQMTSRATLHHSRFQREGSLARPLTRCASSAMGNRRRDSLVRARVAVLPSCARRRRVMGLAQPPSPYLSTAVATGRLQLPSLSGRHRRLQHVPLLEGQRVVARASFSPEAAGPPFSPRFPRLPEFVHPTRSHHRLLGVSSESHPWLQMSGVWTRRRLMGAVGLLVPRLRSLPRRRLLLLTAVRRHTQSLRHPCRHMAEATPSHLACSSRTGVFSHASAVFRLYPGRPLGAPA